MNSVLPKTPWVPDLLSANKNGVKKQGCDIVNGVVALKPGPNGNEN